MKNLIKKILKEEVVSVTDIQDELLNIPFELRQELLDELQSLVGEEDGHVYLTVRDKKNSGSNSYRICVGETDASFTFNMKVENLKLISGDYDVVISKDNLAKFTNHSTNVQYFIALEPDSTYELII